MDAYLADSALWSIGGLIIGYVAGRFHARLMALEKKAEHDDNRTV